MKVASTYPYQPDPNEREPRRAAVSRTGFAAAVLIFALTVTQLAVATFVPGLPQFEGKAFGARLVAYPLLMAAVPACWLLRGRKPRSTAKTPWAAFALIMAPFLVDVTGNSLNLYDAVWWWDDVNHFVNWLLLCSGFGLLLCRVGSLPRWLLVLVITGLGALLAIGWELGEWYTFIRHGTELNTAYQDTLLDEALGTAGGFVAALLVTMRRPSASTSPPIVDD
jgi:hypothetical protein